MRMLLALTASVAMAACATSSATPPNTTAGPSVTPPPPGTVSASTPAAATWRASLRSTNGTSMSGRATVTPSTSGGATATVSLQDATPGEVHPWHVHVGTCASGGGIVGPASAYTPLTVTGGGNANGTAAIPVTLDPAQSYHVNIHQSPTDMGTIVACGDLSASRS